MGALDVVRMLLRMAETGEPYTAARRAVLAEGQAPGGHASGYQTPSPGAGYEIAMSGEIHDWLADLRGSAPPAALRVVQALVALMEEGASLSDPLVTAPAESWPWALVLEGLDVVEDQFPEALLASAGMLRRVRAGQAPEAAAHAYADTRSLLEEIYPIARWPARR